MAYNGLEGKTAVITGAAGGIGSAAVKRLLDEGCNVVGVDLNSEKVEAACADVPRDRFLAVSADVSLPDDCAYYVSRAVERFGSIDVFFNNAGILGTRLPIVEMPVEDFDKIIAVNVRGVFLGLQAVIRQMIKQGTGGSIVNTSSAGALKTYMNSAGYGTSKNAVISLTKVAALESGKDAIRVNAICPGSTDTPLLSAAFGATAGEIAARHPIPRIADPGEIASLAAYLLSDDASFQTGGVYVVDGGLLLV